MDRKTYGNDQRVTKLNAKGCYMCSSPATSKEHVPPRCIFPASSAGVGEMRKQLITVPSCDEHNSRKAADDEFLMVSLAGIFGNNSVGYAHRLGKVNRAVLRTSERLLDAVYTQRTSRFVEIDKNEFLQIIWGTPDIDRLQRCFDRIARGIHFHHFAARFDGEVTCQFGYLNPREANPATFRDFIKHRIEVDLAGKPQLGANPEVFHYRVTDRDQYGYFAFDLCFYGGLHVYAAFIPTDVGRPQNLVTELIEMGIPTSIHLEGKAYEFNFEDDPDKPSG